MFRLRPVSTVWHEGGVIRPSEVPTLDTPYQPVDEESSIEEIAPSTPDPEVVDRGVRGHKTTQNALAAFLSARGAETAFPRTG
jgi:hypothetical protein